MDDLLTLTCSFCQTKFRIKSAHAHLRGRCPVCGFKIKAPRPRLYSDTPLPVSDSHEPLGLVPEDEEWPEPGVPVKEEPQPAEYRFAEPPVVAAKPTAEPVASKDVFTLAPEYQKPKPPVPPATGTTPGNVSAPPVGPPEVPFKLAEETPPLKPKSQSFDEFVKVSAPVKPPGANASGSPPPVKTPAVPLDPLGDDDVAVAGPTASQPASPSVAPAPAATPPKPSEPPRPFDPLVDDILVPAPPRPEPPRAPPPPAKAAGPRFAMPTPEPPPELPPSQPAKPAPTASPAIGLYNFQDAPPGAGTAIVHDQPVGEFDHVHPAPQIAPLPEPPPPTKAPPLAKLAPPDTEIPPLPSDETKPASMEELYSYRLTDAESKPYRAPKPPDKPLWSGVWDFGWRLSSLKMLTWLVIGFTILAIHFALLGWCVSKWDPDGGFTSNIGPGLVFIFVGISTALVGFLLGCYASACFFKVIEETAAGENDITGPEGGLALWMGRLFQLGYLILCGMVVCGLFGFCMGKVAGSLMLLFLWPAVFNTFLLSAMAAEHWWMIINTKVLEKLADKFKVMLALYAWTFVLLGIVIGTWSLALAVSAICVILAGPALAISCLVYARVVGRVGLLLTQEKKEKKRKKKKRKKAQEGAQPDGGDTETAGEPPQSVAPEAGA
jgi:DNA-directed RNA polymerase subunit RPC12/RpoP